MIIIYHRKFAREYSTLPEHIKEIAIMKEAIFRSNPFDSRLKTHKLSGKLNGFWALWVNYEYRIKFEFLENGLIVFYSIGNHGIY